MQKAKVKHPYIESDRRICGGSPVIKGTRVRVLDIAIEYEYLGHMPDEILRSQLRLMLE